MIISIIFDRCPWYLGFHFLHLNQLEYFFYIWSTWLLFPVLWIDSTHGHQFSIRIMIIMLGIFYKNNDDIYVYAVAFGWVWGINIYRWVVQRGNQFHFISIKKPFTLFCTWLVESILEHFIERARKLLERISLRIWIWEKVNSKKFLRDGVLLIPSKDVFQLLIKPSLELKATIKPSMFWLKLYEYQSWRGKGRIVNMNKFVNW